ncbi:hypothetical protein [Streptomyces showdoensis]|uniref:Uncharacterized protein n=1 Tax=Streptomyces showdoensis TaxID=68268 RepID=A0A2P2GLT5_STREW|nr:hypothetical protein [Streptomyces showdoensis]KKZ72467.1 hypothetical protein VO63_18050 [Streptomyces showdoensis]
MSETELLALLRELDDPERLEQPRHYDPAATRLAFGGLVRRLEADFGAPCDFERDTQDSSEYGRVHVPAEATIRGTRIVICVSKFGSLAEVCADNPGAYLGTDEACAEGVLDPADLATVERALAELGYVSVPEELLETDYEGPSDLGFFAARPTWWTRFFGFM